MSKHMQKCPPRFLISFPEIKAIKYLLKWKAIPDKPQQIAWPELLGSSCRKNQGLKNVIISVQPTVKSRGVVQFLRVRNFVQAHRY